MVELSSISRYLNYLKYDPVLISVYCLVIARVLDDAFVVSCHCDSTDIRIIMLTDLFVRDLV